MMGGVTTGNSALPGAHEVTLSNFYIGKFEVTEQQWNDVMSPGTISPTPKKPKEGVTWEQIVGKNGTVNTITSSTVAYTINGVEYFTNGFCAQKYLLTGVQWRLPTEAEWEFAARGGTNNNDYDYAGGNTIGNVGWISGGGTLSEVGKKTANTLGLHDMSGNVCEWCSDLYDAAGALAYSAAVAAQTKNPGGAIVRVNRVLRGGSYFDNNTYARVSYRHNYPPTNTLAGYGFRLACSSTTLPLP
jgi:formylglycine-generating enzyme required for sulfatase activity